MKKYEVSEIGIKEEREGLKTYIKAEFILD